MRRRGIWAIAAIVVGVCASTYGLIYVADKSRLAYNFFSRVEIFS